VSDGAGAVLLMKRSIAMQKGLPILGVFRYDFGAIGVLHFFLLPYTFFGFIEGDGMMGFSLLRDCFLLPWQIMCYI